MRYFVVFVLISVAGTAAFADEPFNEAVLAKAFELSKTCSNECANESVDLVRLALPNGKTGFLVTTRDVNFCGSHGCSSMVVSLTGAKFVVVKEGQGITEKDAVVALSGNAALPQVTHLDAEELSAFMGKITQHWVPPPDVQNGNGPVIWVVMEIKLNRDGSLDGPPVLQEATADKRGPALAESARRAIIESAPFTMFKQEHYQVWKDLSMKFDPRASGAELQRLRQQAAIEQQERSQQQQQEALLEQQRLEDQQREEVKRELASGADALSGRWVSTNIQLDIRKEGPVYIVKATNGHGSVNGEFGGPYKDHQIQLNSMWGNVTVIESTGEILFAGERFSRINQ